jgi:magnesium-transporting ATPase (P-type)
MNERIIMESHKLELNQEVTYMMQEHKLLYETYEHLYTILYQFLRFYFGIIAIPVSLFLAFFKDAQLKEISLYNLPAILVGILFLLTIIGIIFLIIIVNLRFRMIFYAKSTNRSRKYFSDHGYSVDLKDYLKLPVTDEEPKYYEGVTHHFPCIVILMAFLNSVLFWIPLLNIIKNFFIAAVIIIFLFLAQYLLYMWFAKGKDRDYTKK